MELLVGGNEERKSLIDAVRSRLLPLFLERSFAVAPLSSRGQLDWELVVKLPLGRLTRRRAAGGVDLVEIDFAVRRSAFRLLAGVAPAGGVSTLTGVWPAADVYVAWLDEYFEMYASPAWRRWFSVRGWPWQVPGHEDHQELAAEVGGLVPEIEAALRDGQLGPHMRRVVMRPRVPER